MRMSEGVEWALHCCLTLAWLEGEAPVPTNKLAASFEVPAAYLNKCLQALVRAGILISSAGIGGGFRLARRPEKISLLDVVVAIEGPEPAFRCMEIRQRGAGAGGTFRRTCSIAAAMRRAERAWQSELAAQSLADIVAATPAAAHNRMRCWLGRPGK